MFDSHKNLAQSLLAAVPVDRTTGTGFKVSPGDAQLFAPNMPVTLAPYGKDPSYDNAEIAYVTSVDGDSLVIARGTEGSIPKRVEVGWVIAGTVTAGTLEAIEDAVLTKADQTYVDELVDGLDLRGDVRTVAGRTGNVVLSKADVGLNLVDNTSDAAKPVSAATQTALDAKYNASNPAGFVDASQAAASAPVQSVAGRQGAVTLAKGDVGLGNVDNTSDASKPVSTATSIALATKVDKVDGLALSSNDYTGTEKTKLAGIASGATANAADASLRDRATHTGTQAVSTVLGLQTALDAKLQVGGDIGGTPSLPKAKVRMYLTVSRVSGSVADYICDGVADDIQIQQAIDAVASAGGGTIFLRSGLYRIAAPLVFPFDAKVRIVGEKFVKGATGGVTLKTSASVALTDMIVVSAPANPTTNAGLTHDNGIEQLTLDGNSTTTNLISLINADYFTIGHVRLILSTNAIRAVWDSTTDPNSPTIAGGIRVNDCLISANSGVGIDLQYQTQCWITNTWFTGSGVATWINFKSSNKIHVSNCEFNTATTALRFQDTATFPTNDITINDSVFAGGKAWTEERTNSLSNRVALVGNSVTGGVADTLIGSDNVILNSNGGKIKTLEVTGALATAVTARSSATTLDATHCSVELNTTATQTLPALATCQGRMYEFVNINAGAATIKGNGAELIGNVTTANTYTLPSGAAVTLKAFPSAWRVV
ncbi:hypothetical protein EDF22_1344 [Rathayibacter sp. PhB127]|uniref:right-handed parallel beta-helix repeat-containing protein n=1 Tax=Rathayibacter sp. PhB127 TaxID=2485176 RepID=UPI000F4BC612|nr:right-handed parallel beta-helix repeat-containing protein [Rathayibacter sp. PhB127]ROS29600.1 hypothetical protein EDF22_1344 [Rathayibacter sp. PhB127]